MVFLVLLFSAREALAQSDRAAITGTVRDISGAVVVGAQIVATSLDNNRWTITATDKTGSYHLLNLPTGRYELVCSKEGFARRERPGINLAIAEVAEIDVVLTIGADVKTAAVTAGELSLQTQTSSISTNLTNAAITELPLNVQGGRNLSAFMFAYEPGVEGSGANPSDKDFSSHINGSLSDTKEVMIDGTSAVSQIGGYLSESSPPMEAVQEFQVTSAGIGADQGRTGGGVFRYEMKSGTNAWHGSGFYYLHNEAFDARSFGDVYNEAICLDGAGGNAAQMASCERGFGKPDDRLYDYGASFGGPIRKDKLFFYAAWERYTFADAGIGALSSTVPTPAFLSGDFSALLGGTLCNGSIGIALCNGYAGSNPTPVIVQNDAGQTIPAQQNMIFDPANACGTPPCQFTGNMIPSNRISKVSQNIINLYNKYYPPLSSTLTNNNALPLSTPATWYQSNQASIKLDYDLSQRHRLDGSFIYAYIPRLLSDQGGIWSAGSEDGGPMANAYDHNTTAPALRLRDAWVISNTLLNVASVTFNRFRNPSDARSRDGNWPSTLGLGNFGAGNFPIIKFQGVNSDQHRYVAGLPIDETLLGSQFNDFYAANTFIYNDTLSWVHGRHTYKFGAEFRAQQFDSHGDYGVPTFIFDPAQTAGTLGVNGGFGFASFLLGDVNQGSVSEPDNTYGRRKSVSLFAHDDVKVSSRLTLNLDLRWDFNGRYHEKYGDWSNFNTSEINPVTGSPGSLDFATGGSDSFEKQQYYHNFSGYVGGAYQITPKTVARASFGVFYVPLNLNTYSGIPYEFNPGFVLNNQVLTPFDWDSGYPGQVMDIGKNPNFTRYGMVSVDPHMLELGNVQAWSAGVQREISHGLVVEANFIQNQGYHLESGYVQANQPKLSAYTALVQSGQQYAWITEQGFQGIGWASVAPFPNVAMTYGPLFFVGSPLGNTNYKSLQISAKKQTTHGLSLLASYSLSSSHGDVDNAFEDLYYPGPLQDVYNLQQERNTISDFDQTHIVKGYVLYDLPFGRGKGMLSGAGSALNALVGGWTITGDFHYASGMPMRIPANVYYPGINNVYSDIVPGCDISEHYNGQVGGTYFNPGCFVNPPNGEFGNAPGYLAGLRNPRLAVEDLGMNKNLRLSERTQVHLYCQIFNVLNRHGVSGPNTQIGTAGFGTVLPQDLNGIPGPRVGQFGARFTF
jgi:Carboxypeptidase regulatory-like domain